jgi:glycosyltransferase involved in cell wall biosynthesis
VSKFALEVTNKLFKIKADIPQTVIYNGIDISQFKPANDVSESIVLYYGTLIRKKGCLELPLIFNEVVRKIPNAKLVLAGHDSVDIRTGSKSTWSLMQALFSNEALKQTEYVGKLPYNEIQTLISKAAVCVFPSYAEAFPVSWLEAMAMGKAIVTSDIGWATEAVEHGVSGFCCSPSDYLRFSNFVLKLLEEGDVLREIGNQAATSVKKNFDITQKAIAHIQFYNLITN